MTYLRKPVQGAFSVTLNPGQIVTVEMATQLDTPNDSEFWEVGLVTVRVFMPTAGLPGYFSGNNNSDFIGDASISSPPKADIRVALRAGEFFFLEESLAGGYTFDSYRMISDLSSPIVVRPSEQIDLDLSFVSHNSTVLSSDAPGPLVLEGNFNAMLLGNVTEG